MSNNACLRAQASDDSPLTFKYRMEGSGSEGAASAGGAPGKGGRQGLSIQSAGSGKAPKGSVLDRIVNVIRQQKSATGSTSRAITKALSEGTAATAIRKALVKGVAEGTLALSSDECIGTDGKLNFNKASFLVKGEKYEGKVEKVSIEDLEVGSGAAAESGSEISINYKGTLSGGSSFDSGKLSFTLGAGDVVKGMDQGCKGMRVGGRRKLTIPSSLGYGKRGSPPEIPPNATLCFDVRLLAVK